MVVFSSVIFLFLFLPIVLAVGLTLQAIANRTGGRGWALRAANGWLVVVSLVFYAWGEARLVWLLLFSCALNYVGGLLVDRRTWRRAALAAVVTANLGLLAWFKYSNLAADLANRLNNLTGHAFGPGLKWSGVALPLGISFFTFHGISYVIDVAREKVRPTRNLLDYTCYYTLFPQLVAGPIVRFSQVSGSFTQRRVGWDDLTEGIARFMVGLAKKTLIANQVAGLADAVFALAPGDRSAVAAWLGVCAYALQIYFDFSGYSDMAIGMGRMFGFRFPENFNHPYASGSVREFWRRWHMTLSSFYRDYLYIPLGGNRRGSARTAFNLVLVFALCGLWHGANWTFLIWGLFHGFFLAAERVLEPVTARIPGAWRPFGHVYTLLVVLGGWVLFRCDTFAQAVGYFQALAGGGARGYFEALPWNVLAPDVLLAFCAGVFFSVPSATALRAWGQRQPVVRRCVEPAVACGIVAIFVLALLAIGSGSHNPFIYYRF